MRKLTKQEIKVLIVVPVSGLLIILSPYLPVYLLILVAAALVLYVLMEAKKLD